MEPDVAGHFQTETLVSQTLRSQKPTWWTPSCEGAHMVLCQQVQDQVRTRQRMNSTTTPQTVFKSKDLPLPWSTSMTMSPVVTTPYS